MCQQRHLGGRHAIVLAAVFLAGHGLAGAGRAQGTSKTPGATAKPATIAAPPEVTNLLKALQVDPLTARYRFQVDVKGGRYVLKGRVGTRAAHDTAIRTAIALGVPVRDDVVIDTSLAAYAPMPSLSLPASALPSPMVYPPPLMGRIDEPFYGYEPPLLTFPSWWGALAAREPLTATTIDPTATPAAEPGAAGPAGSAGPAPVVLSVDTRGVATLRGNVPTEAERLEVGEKVARSRGISQVVNLLEVDPRAPSVSGPPASPPSPAGRADDSSRIPPPPRPDPPTERVEGRPITSSPIATDTAELSRRVSHSMTRRPVLAPLPIRIATRDGVVTLTGRVPTAYEAMLAYRAADQTPGVREVDDRLEFELPDVDRPNPLHEKGRPEDLEPYLLAHLRKQLGGIAHLDRVRISGDAVELRGTVSSADDIPRVEAALRSFPLLRGFRVDARFLAE